MALADIKQRPGLVLGFAVVLHLVIISTQVSTASGMPILRAVTNHTGCGRSRHRNGLHVLQASEGKRADSTASREASLMSSGTVAGVSVMVGA